MNSINKAFEKERMKKYFEEKYLKNTCFETLNELLNDRTTVEINAPRALIAVDLIGVWKGLNDNQLQSEIQEIVDELNYRYDQKDCFYESEKNQLKKEIERLKHEIEYL